MSDLLVFTDRGIYCPPADLYIDPWRNVDKALITHAHSDHARRGSSRYICTTDTLPVLKHRLGRSTNALGVAYGEKLQINGVTVSFHPAGHIIGSAQIRVEYKGQIAVASGDYKTVDDQFSGAFEPLKCHMFITECTFGLPVYNWPPQTEVVNEINEWWALNAEKGITSVISAYSLGKAQRVVQSVDHSIGPVLCHDSVQDINDVLVQSGVNIKTTSKIHADTASDDLKNALVVAPGGISGAAWTKGIKTYSSASASGWMAIRGRRRWQSVDRGFVLSDHADWAGLIEAVKATGASTVVATHGYTDVFARWLREQRINARTEKTMFEQEQQDPGNA